jgi:hypothetical protein
MGRIGGLIRLVYSDIPELKPTGFLTHTGVAADLLRSSTVFLHAAFEDLVRSLSGRPGSWSFHSGADLDKRLKDAGIQLTAFVSLYPPLTQLAKRRHRIVHHADLSASNIEVASWTVTDYWQLTMWNLAVICFYYRLIMYFEPNNQPIRHSHDQIVTARSSKVDFAKRMLDLANAPEDSRIEAFKRMADALNVVKNVLENTHIKTAR